MASIVVWKIIFRISILLYESFYSELCSRFPVSITFQIKDANGEITANEILMPRP
ncbi:hypothetical protein LCGC14_1927720, partial [marine sediment metagenome]